MSFSVTVETPIHFLVQAEARIWFKNSQYKNGTTKAYSMESSAVPYSALQSDRRLVITTWSDGSAPFHGANARSNPAGDAKSITYRENIYSPFSKRIEIASFPTSSIGVDEADLPQAPELALVRW